MAKPSHPEVEELPVAPSEPPREAAESDGQQKTDLDPVSAPEASGGPVAEAEDFKPAGSELVVSDPEEVFAVLDKHDESQILDELQGRLTTEWFYKFPNADGHEVVGLSYKCVRDVIHQMNHTGKCRIRVIPGSDSSEVVEENGEPHYRCQVWAEDLVTGSAFSGLSHEPKRMKLKPATAKKRRDKGQTIPEDNTVWDEFAETKALNKSERNALDKFIPETVRQTLIAQYMNDPGRVKQIKRGAGVGEEMAELPPPLTDVRADELRTKCRDLYERIKEADPEMRVEFPPGQFNLLLRRAEWEHKALEEFAAHLEGLLEKAAP